MVLEINTKAPAFSLPNQDGKKMSLADFKGSFLVLYFYPKDNTPGCTIEAIDFTKYLGDFKKLGCAVVGVSPDSTESHCKFIDKKNLKITLLSDPDKKMLTDYGVWAKKKFMGREYMGVLRTTYLIDGKGKIVHVWENVKVRGHVEDVLSKVKELN